MAALGPISLSTLDSLQSTVLNLSGNIPLSQRYRALFTLKNLGKISSDSVSHLKIKDKPEVLVSDTAIDIIAQGFTDPSALLKHELAYVLGQMGNPKAIGILENVLQDQNQDAMVRHEVVIHGDLRLFLFLMLFVRLRKLLQHYLRLLQNHFYVNISTIMNDVFVKRAKSLLLDSNGHG